MGVFRHGFFAKPVIRSDEENYRYIMALDRWKREGYDGQKRIFVDNNVLTATKIHYFN